MKYLPLLLVLLIGCQQPATVAPKAVIKKPAVVKPTLVRIIGFTMVSCAPCKQMKPEWKRVNAKVYNVHQYQVLAQKYNITQCPTTIWLDENGKEVKRVAGYQHL